MKKCPYCAEEIQDEAILCRYCKSMLPEVQTSTASESTVEENEPLQSADEERIIQSETEEKVSEIDYTDDSTESDNQTNDSGEFANLKAMLKESKGKKKKTSVLPVILAVCCVLIGVGLVVLLLNRPSIPTEPYGPTAFGYMGKTFDTIIKDFGSDYDKVSDTIIQYKDGSGYIVFCREEANDTSGIYQIILEQGNPITNKLYFDIDMTMSCNSVMASYPNSSLIYDKENKYYLLDINFDLDGDSINDFVIGLEYPDKAAASQRAYVNLISDRSKPSDMITLPYLVGMSVQEIESKYGDHINFSIKYEYEYNNVYEKGMIYRQNPNSGTSVEKGSTVVLYVSKGAKTNATTTTTENQLDTSPYHDTFYNCVEALANSIDMSLHYYKDMGHTYITVSGSEKTGFIDEFDTTYYNDSECYCFDVTITDNLYSSTGAYYGTYYVDKYNYEVYVNQQEEDVTAPTYPRNELLYECIVSITEEDECSIVYRYQDENSNWIDEIVEYNNTYNEDYPISVSEDRCYLDGNIYYIRTYNPFGTLFGEYTVDITMLNNDNNNEEARSNYMLYMCQYVDPEYPEYNPSIIINPDGTFIFNCNHLYGMTSYEGVWECTELSDKRIFELTLQTYSSSGKPIEDSNIKNTYIYITWYIGDNIAYYEDTCPYGYAYFGASTSGVYFEVTDYS